MGFMDSNYVASFVTCFNLHEVLQHNTVHNKGRCCINTANCLRHTACGLLGFASCLES